MSAAKPRIAPGSRRDIGLLNSGIARVIALTSGGRPPNIFTTLGRNRSLFRRWLRFAAALMPGGRLPRADSELLILRVAHNCGSEYEWSQHERLGAAAGLNAAEIERVREGPGAAGWSERRSLLLRAADEMHATDRRIADSTWEGLAGLLGAEELIELCLLVGHYEMLAMTLNSLDVQLDPPGGRAGSSGRLARGLQSLVERRARK